MEREEPYPEFVVTDANNSNQLLTRDTEILLSILPSNVWAYAFKKLEKKHPPALKNLSNSSLYFRNVILSKRVLFLFPQVIKLIGPEFANQNNTQINGSDIIRSRIICKSWTKAVDQFIINDTLEPEFFNTQPHQPSDHALVNARYQYFGHMSSIKLSLFLSHFEQTHLPHSSRNPFIGKVVHIDLTGFTNQTEWPSIADQVTTLLRKYGNQIQILNLGLFSHHPDIPDPHVQLENHRFLLECMGYCPNLTHLKVSEKFDINGEMDVGFGERPDPRRRERRRRFEEQNHLALLFGVLYDHLERNVNPREQLQGMGDQMNNPAPREDPLNLELEPGMGPHGHHGQPRIRPIDAVSINTVPTLKYLQCLKSCNLSHYNFNTLISANPHVVWLQVEPLKDDKRSYIDFLALELPNLTKLYIKLCSRAEVRKLKNVHKSLLQLTHLHFEYCTSEVCCMSAEFMEWIEIFAMIYQKWGNTLTDLKVRLPMARRKRDADTIARDSGHFRLHMPKLKRLKIWLNERPGERNVAKTDFLDLVRVGLEQLVIE